MFKNFIYLSLLLQFSRQPNILAFQPITENNHVLVGHVLQQLFATDWFNCIQACHDEPRCISYNYERSAEANGLCELNYCGVESSCDRQISVIYSKGFVFQQLRESKDKTIYALAENKSKTQQSSGPIAPPESVRAVNRTMYSIGIKWDEVPQSLRNGLITSYTVSYHSDTYSEAPQTKVLNAPARFANLTHLTKNTNYTITVQASNDKGPGPASDSIVVATSDGSVFQCPSQNGDLWLKDPNSCYRYYRCSNGQFDFDCPAGTELKLTLIGSPCGHVTKPYCHL